MPRARLSTKLLTETDKSKYQLVKEMNIPIAEIENKEEKHITQTRKLVEMAVLDKENEEFSKKQIELIKRKKVKKTTKTIKPNMTIDIEGKVILMKIAENGETFGLLTKSKIRTKAISPEMNCYINDGKKEGKQEINSNTNLMTDVKILYKSDQRQGKLTSVQKAVFYPTGSNFASFCKQKHKT